MSTQNAEQDRTNERAAVLGLATGESRRILEGCLEGRPLGVEAALVLCTARGRDLHALAAVLLPAARVYFFAAGAGPVESRNCSV